MRKFILWDHDGVLVDTEEWYFKATQRGLEEFSVHATREQCLEFMVRGQSLWDLARDRDVPEEVIETHKQKRDRYYQEYLVSEDIEIPGVTEVLAELGAVCSMAIVTTAKRVDFELIHRSRNIVPFMEFVLTVEDYPRAKPEPDPYLAGLERFQAEPGDAIVIEDSERGLRSAVSAGIDCVIVENEFTRSHDFSKAKRVVESISNLPECLNLL